MIAARLRILAHRSAQRAGLLSLLLGGAAACGFAPFELWPVTLLCLALWMRLVHDAQTLPTALWRGWLFGVAHFTVGNNWIQHAFTFQQAVPAWLGWIAVVLLALYLALYPMLAAGLMWRLASPRAVGEGGTAPGGSFILVASASWIITEWLRATMLTGYPWNPLSEIWLPLLGVARTTAFIGSYALSGVTMLIAGCGLLLFGRRWRLAIPVLGATALLALTGLNVPAAPPSQRDGAPPNLAPRIRVIQPNLDQEERPRDDYSEANLSAIEGLLGTPGRSPRLIVWPEGALRFSVERGYPAYAYWRGSPDDVLGRIAQHLGPRDIVLTGGQGLQFNRQDEVSGATNSVFAIDAGARLLGRYDKAHLVPWGEYLPARPLTSAIGLARLVAGDVDFKPGPGPGGFALPGFGLVGFQICYEIIFSGETVDRAHRPRFLFNPSNDSWYSRWGPAQHLAQARMRAMEEGLPVIRATPTGISAIIDADGRILAQIPPHVAGAVEAPLPPSHPPTLFAVMGNAMAAIVALAMVILAVAIRHHPR